MQTLRESKLFLARKPYGEQFLRNTCMYRPRGSISFLLAFTALLTATSFAAGEKPRAIIRTAQVGLPAARTSDGQDGHISKVGAWSPLSYSIEINEPIDEAAELVVETPDSDGITTSLKIPLKLAGLRGIHSSNELGLTYIRPSASGGETIISIRSAVGVEFSEPYRIRSLRPREQNSYIVLAIGNDLPGFDLPLTSGKTNEHNPALGQYRNNRIELAAITDLSRLPDQWFGYEAADLVILTTTSETILPTLFASGASPFSTRRDALLEWVSRGGRLVISLASNAKQATQLEELKKLLPCQFMAEPSRLTDRLVLSWSARDTSQTAAMGATMTARGEKFSAANWTLSPNRPGRVVMPPRGRQTPDQPSVGLQSGYGLGKITALGFDLESKAFSEFPGRAEVWDWILREGGANRASIGLESVRGVAPVAAEEDLVAGSVQNHIDNFEAIPVISFSWVAVLIILYIILIGPIEYFFLKRILGRLEWTWATFPIIVLSICLVAYSAAVSAKGRDLRINKIDVVDVVSEFDPVSKRTVGKVVGTTWMTLFSPLIDDYSLEIVPADSLGSSPHQGKPLISWMGGPRGGRAGLVRRKYLYHTAPDSNTLADALIDVPVPIWSTKSFTASWSVPIDPALPLAESQLEHPSGDPNRVVGTFINRTPFPELSDCVVYYAGQAYPIGAILSGQEVRLVLEKGIQSTQWLQENSQLSELLGRGGGFVDRNTNAQSRLTPNASVIPARSSGLPLWGMLFHEAALRNDEGVFPRNASLRRLDQSWRLAPDQRDSVVVIGRVPPLSGAADALFGGPNSPSRLWLKVLPAEGKERPVLPGFGRQETYVRFYLPIRS